MGRGRPDLRKRAAGPRGPENEDFIKRMCQISVRTGSGLRLEKKWPPSLESEDQQRQARINIRPQRIARNCSSKAQIGNKVLTKSAACAQKLTEDG